MWKTREFTRQGMKVTLDSCMCNFTLFLLWLLHNYLVYCTRVFLGFFFFGLFCLYLTVDSGDRQETWGVGDMSGEYVMQQSSGAALYLSLKRLSCLLHFVTYLFSTFIYPLLFSSYLLHCFSLMLCCFCFTVWLFFCTFHRFCLEFCTVFARLLHYLPGLFHCSCE